MMFGDADGNLVETFAPPWWRVWEWWRWYREPRRCHAVVALTWHGETRRVRVRSIKAAPVPVDEARRPRQWFR